MEYFVSFGVSIVLGKSHKGEYNIEGNMGGDRKLLLSYHNIKIEHIRCIMLSLSNKI